MIDATAFDADVLVVGCGPVGVTAALRCVQRGLSAIAVDRSTEIYPLPRALAMDEENQAMFERAGLLEAMHPHLASLPGAEFVDAEGVHVVGFELPDGTTGSLGHPPAVVFDQPGIERALRAGATDAGVELRLGHTVTAIEQDDDGVTATVDDGTTLRARWLVAADGAKSTVRDLVGIEMVDQGFDQTWLVIDTTLLDDTVELPRLAQQRCDPARITTVVPGPGRHRRWEFRLHPDETREQILEPAAIEQLLAPWGTPAQLRLDRSAVYRFHAKVAATFRVGRVFLAGDAAHQMPPFNGQGMCTGLRDAELLSWILADVTLGRAHAALLDAYDAERRPHSTEQVIHSVDSGLLMQAIAEDGDAALGTGYGQRPFPKRAGPLVEPGHPLVGGPLPAPSVPTELPDDGWFLVSTDGPRPVAHRAVEAVRVDPAAFPLILDATHAMLVRPDRLIAAVTEDPATSIARLVPQPTRSESSLV